MWKHANVAAAQDGDARIESELEARTLPGNALRLGLLSLLPPCILRGSVARRKRGTQCDLVLGHQLEYLRRAAVAMLDGLRATQHRPAHPLGCAGVDRDRNARAL